MKSATKRGSVHMQVTTIGLDLAKSIFQVHGIDAGGRPVVRKALRRAQMLPFFESLAPCLIGMERAVRLIIGRGN